MKHIYKIFIAITLITGLWSCENEDEFNDLRASGSGFCNDYT
jgi:hypothetical protein